MVGPLPRFVPLEWVMETLSVSKAQAYALVRRGDLPAIRVGGRGQWRVEVTEFEAFVQRAYQESEQLRATGDLPTTEPCAGVSKGRTAPRTPTLDRDQAAAGD